MLCVALRGGSSPNWLQCDPSAWGGPQVCVAIVRVVAASADLRVPMPPRGKIPPGPQRERLFCYRAHYAQAGSLLSVATEAYVCELERRAPASGARFSAMCVSSPHFKDRVLLHITYTVHTVFRI
jgi:hypothetical protein